MCRKYLTVDDLTDVSEKAWSLKGVWLDEKVLMWSRLTRGGTLGVQCIQHKGTLSFANIVSTHGLVSKFVDKLWAVVNFQGLAMGLWEKKMIKTFMTEIMIHIQSRQSKVSYLVPLVAVFRLTANPWKLTTAQNLSMNLDMRPWVETIFAKLKVQCIQHKGTLSFENIVWTYSLVSEFVDKLWAVVNFQGLAMGLREERNKNLKEIIT